MVKHKLDCQNINIIKPKAMIYITLLISIVCIAATIYLVIRENNITKLSDITQLKELKVSGITFPSWIATAVFLLPSWVSANICFGYFSFIGILSYIFHVVAYTRRNRTEVITYYSSITITIASCLLWAFYVLGWFGLIGFVPALAFTIFALIKNKYLWETWYSLGLYIMTVLNIITCLIVC